MGIFGGDSVTRREEQANNNADNRVSEGDGAIGGNVNFQAGGNIDNVNVSTTDFGALDAAESIYEISAGLVRDATSRAFDFGQSVANQAISENSDVVTNANTDDASENIRTLIIGLSVVAVVFFSGKIF